MYLKHRAAKVLHWKLRKYFGPSRRLANKVPAFAARPVGGYQLIFAVSLGALALITGVFLCRPEWNLAVFFWLNHLGQRYPLLAQILSHLADTRWVAPLLISLFAARLLLLGGLMAAALIIHLSVKGLKNYFAMPRPLFDPQLTGQVFTAGPPLNSDMFSFPSGHSATAALVAVALVVLWRRRALLPAVLLMLGVAASRSMLGAHFPSDTAAGLALGLSLTCGAYGLTLLTFNFPKIRPWGRVGVVIIALGLLTKIALQPMPTYPLWFQLISLSGCILAMGILLYQTLYRWWRFGKFARSSSFG